MANQSLGTVTWKAIERDDKAWGSLLLASSADAFFILEHKPVFDVALWSFLRGNRQWYLKVQEVILSEISVANGLSNETLYRMMKSGLMFWAIDLDVINVARPFVDSGTDPYQDALLWVVKNRNVETVKYSLERGYDPKNQVFISSLAYGARR